MATEKNDTMSLLTQKLSQSWDLILLLVIFVYLTQVAADLGQSGRYAYVFLLMGIVAVSIQLVINFLPSEYSKRIQELTEGASGAFDDELDETVEEQDISESEAKRKIALTVGLIAGYAFASYLITFLYATPLFVFATIFLVGEKDIKKAVVLSVILLALVYFLFGEIMRVPVDEGVLLEVLLG